MFTWRCKAEPKIHCLWVLLKSSKGKKLHWLWALGQRWSENLFLGWWAVCVSFACKSAAEFFETPAFFQSDFPCWFQPGPSDQLLLRKTKRQISESQKCSQSVHPLPITILPITVQISLKIINKSNFNSKTGPSFLQFSDCLGVWYVEGSSKQMYTQQKLDIGKEKSPWIMCLMQKNAIKLFFMEVYPSETADISFIIFSNTNSWELCLGSLQIKCWKDSGGVKEHLFLLLRPTLCCHSWWILSLRLFLGIKHLAFVAGSCYKEQERRFSYVPWHREREWATTECWCKGKKVMQQSPVPWMHTGELIDHNSVIPERKGKMRAWSALRDRNDLGNLQMCHCMLSRSL